MLDPLKSAETTLFHAKRYVARGLARWAGGAIEFPRNPDDHRETSAQRACQFAYDRAASTGIADVEAVRHLPVAGPAIRMFTERTKTPHRAPKGRNGPVRLVVRTGQKVA